MSKIQGQPEVTDLADDDVFLVGVGASSTRRITKSNLQAAFRGPAGPQGPQGPEGVGGLPGGSTGQVARKASNANYDAEWHTLAKADVGLANVDNTSDANKPVSTAQQAALDLKADAAATATALLARALQFESRTAAAAASIPASYTALRTAGFYGVGDGGSAQYVRATSAPAYGGFRSADRYLPNGTTDATNGGYWKLDEAVLKPQHFGAKGDGATDDIAAFNAMTSYWLARGGDVVIPPANYMLNATWAIARDSVPINYSLRGYGAVLFAGPAVTGPAIRVTGSYGEYLSTFEGLAFNHRGNATVLGCIEVLGGHRIDIVNCTAEFHSLQAGWYFARLGPSTPGSDGTNSFWCTIRGCSTRKRSGSETGNGTYGVLMVGAANANNIRDNSFSNLAYGVFATPDTNNSLPNTALIEGNWFETIDTAGVCVQLTNAQYGHSGWRIMNNRFENMPKGVSLPISSGSALQNGVSTVAFNSYSSVTAPIDNTSGYWQTVIEPQAPGLGVAIPNTLYMGAGFKFVVGGTGYNIDAVNTSNSGRYDTAWFIGGQGYTRVSTSDGKVRVKTRGAGLATSDTDGTVVGTQT